MGTDSKSRERPAGNDQVCETEAVVGWRAILSNGNSVQEDMSDVSSWRKLRDYCRKKNLKISELCYNGQPVYQNADAYFAFFNMLSTTGGVTHTKRAVGCFKKNDHGKCKTRVTWYEHGTTRQIGPTEVEYEDGWESAELAREMMIERTGANKTV